MDELDVFGLQIEQRVDDGLVAGRGLLWYRLVGLAVLVDDEVNARLLHAQEVEADVRGCACAGRVGERS